MPPLLDTMAIGKTIKTPREFLKLYMTEDWWGVQFVGVFKVEALTRETVEWVLRVAKGDENLKNYDKMNPGWAALTQQVTEDGLIDTAVSFSFGGRAVRKVCANGTEGIRYACHMCRAEHPDGLPFFASSNYVGGDADTLSVSSATRQTDFATFGLLEAERTGLKTILPFPYLLIHDELTQYTYGKDADAKFQKLEVRCLQWIIASHMSGLLDGFTMSSVCFELVLANVGFELRPQFLNALAAVLEAMGVHVIVDEIMTNSRAAGFVPLADDEEIYVPTDAEDSEAEEPAQVGGAQGGESSSSNTAPQRAGSLLYLDYLKREKGVRLLPLFTIVGKTIQMSVVLQHRKWSLPEHAQERGVSTSMGAARAYLAKLVSAQHCTCTTRHACLLPWHAFMCKMVCAPHWPACTP